MLRRVPRGILTILAFVLGTAFLVPIIQINVEEWAKARGYDQFMIKHWNPVMDWLASYTQTLWFTNILGFVVGGTVFLWADWFLRSRQKALIETSSSSPPPTDQDRIAAQAVHLQLLFRRNQEPQEIAKQNVWRWFVFTNLGVEKETGQKRILSTQIFLTFDQPIHSNYRRIVCSKDVRANVLDFTARSAIVSIEEVELADWTIDIQFSATPL